MFLLIFIIIFFIFFYCQGVGPGCHWARGPNGHTGRRVRAKPQPCPITRGGRNGLLGAGTALALAPEVAGAAQARRSQNGGGCETTPEHDRIELTAAGVSRGGNRAARTRRVRPGAGGRGKATRGSARSGESRGRRGGGGARAEARPDPVTGERGGAQLTGGM